MRCTANAVGGISMRFPKMQAGSQYRVTVPTLDGGLNLKDAPNLVEDNQLTDVKNMWWYGQALRTRPGLYTQTQNVWSAASTNMGDYFDYHVYPAVEITEENDENIYVPFRYTNEGSQGYDTYFEIFRIGTDYQIKESINFYTGENQATDGFFFSYEMSNDKNGFYAFMNNGSIYRMTGETSHSMVKVDESDIYVPLVAVNVKPWASGESAMESGTFFEGYNLLTKDYRVMYTPDGENSSFGILSRSLSLKELQVTVTQTDGTEVTHTVSTDNPDGLTAMNESEAGTDGLKLYYRGSSGEFYFMNTGGQRVSLPFVGFSSSIEAIVRPAGEPEGKSKIFGMRFCTWFGGEGINGGTRLFVSGNKDEPNVVRWSDVNNPLYFPESNYAYIGNAGQSVTAFGKQSNILTVFKQKEIYCTEYVSGTSYTAQDVIDGKVVDVSAAAAVFPILQIHPSIGCDCPGTIQLCNNRLIWTNSDGRVYTLLDKNQYSERNIRELSQMIFPRTYSHSKYIMNDAVSCNFYGHYILMVGKNWYVLNYMDSNVQYYIGYSDERKAQRKMQWYTWDIPDGMTCLCTSSANTGPLLILGFLREIPDFLIKTLYLGAFSFEGETDICIDPDEDENIKSIPINSLFQTKVFDFGSPDRHKFIRRIFMGASDTKKDFIHLSYISDNNVFLDTYKLGEYGNGEMREWTISPGINRACKFGIRAESAGNMAIENIVIKYEISGEV